MAIDGIKSLSEAIKLYNNPNTSNETKREILSKYPDVVKYVSNDTTEYQISDEDKESAKAQGNQNAKDATGGFDGKADNTASTVTSANNVVGGVAGAAAGVLATMPSVLNNILCFCNNVKVAFGAIVAAVGALLLTNAIYLKSAKPNEEPANACEEMTGVLQEEQGVLEETQEAMEEAEEEFTALSEEAEDVNKKANDKINEDKTKFDFYRTQYNALKDKAQSGEKLTKEEKSLMQKLAPQMEGLGVSIADTQEETSDTVSDLSEDMAEYQDTFDESAETMETIQGETEYLAGFDEDTESNAKAVATTSYIGVAGSLGVMGAGYKVISQAWSKGWGAAAEIVLGGVAVAEGIASGLIFRSVIQEQNEFANTASIAIDTRGTTEELNSETTDIYDEKLDTYAGQVDLVDDLELEVPDDLEMPEQPAATTDGTESANPFGAQPTEEGQDGQAGTRGSDGTDGGSGNAGGAGSGTVPLDQNPSYINKMGDGSNWSEVMNGNIKRDNDNDIVKDSSGRVVLTQQYADAITSETGAKEGEFFSKDSIPKILAKVLGAPFDEKMIRDVHSGKKLSSEYAAKIIQTKTGNEKGDTIVDNTDKATELAKKVIDFYYPIFSQASTQGWVKG